MDRVGDLFPTFTTADSVKAIQGQLNADFTAIRLALIKCAEAGKFPDTSPDFLAWQNIKSRILAYLAESPSWIITKDQIDRGQLLQRELYAWHDRVKALGAECDAGPPPMLPPESSLSSLFGGLSLGAIVALVLVLVLRDRR